MCTRSAKQVLIAAFAVATLALPAATAHAATKPGASEIRTTESKTAQTVRQLDAANGLLQRGMYDLAEAEYRGVLAARPDAATQQSAEYGLGVCLFRLGKYADAIDVLAPLSEATNFEFAAEVGVMLGRSLAALGRNADAVAAFDTVAQRSGKHELAATASAGAIDALYRAGDYDAILKRAPRVLRQLDAGAVRQRVQFIQALCELNTGDYTGAETHLTALLENDLDAAMAGQARLIVGQCAARRGAYEDAVKWFAGVLESKDASLHAEAQLASADALYRSGKSKAAEVAVDAMLRGDTDEKLAARAQYLKGRLQFDAGEYADARAAFVLVQTSDAVDAGDLGYWIAKCALRAGDATKAAELLTRLHAEHPDCAMAAEAEYDRAVALIACERSAEATNVLDEFRTRFAKHVLAAGALHLQAVAAQRAGDMNACSDRSADFLKAYPDDPSAADVQLLAGQCAYGAENWADVIANFAVFVKRFAEDPRATDAAYRAGLAAYRLARYDDAEQWFGRLPQGDALAEKYAPAALALGDIAFQRSDWENAERWLSVYLSQNAVTDAGDDALLKRGLALRKLARQRDALADFEALLANRPNSPHRGRAQVERGELLAELGDSDAAQQAFAEVARSGDGGELASLATYQRAVLAMQAGEYAQAVKLLTEMLESEGTSGRSAEALYQRARCRMALGEYAEAVADFAKLREAYPDSTRAVAAQAWTVAALARQDQAADALAAYDQINQSDWGKLDSATRSVVTQERAWALRTTGDVRGADEAYATLLAMPDVAGDTRAHAELAVAEIAIDRDGCDAAADRLQRLTANAATSDLPSSVRERALYRVGLCALQGEHWEDAQNAFNSLLTDYPESSYRDAARVYCGEAAAQRGRYSEAQALLEPVVEACGDDALCAPAMLRLGEALAAQQRWLRSEQVLTDYLKRYADDPAWYQAQFGIAWAREHQERYADAMVAYREVVARHQGATAARAQFQIGECLFAQGEHEEAVRELLKVDILYDYPEWSAAALYEAGRCFEQMGRRVDARKQFEAVLERYQDSQWAKPAEERLPKLTASAVPGH
ncbi:MAG: tetratricopeptide repeat protein [Phycisphaerales bacterium]|nr:tetratricopeptide repeat protein [Phycisphaerales bacterium]